MLFLTLDRPVLEKPLCDGVELRVDLFPTINREEISQLIKRLSPLPILLTLRKGSEGGSFQGSERERLGWIEQLLKLKPDFLDLEWDTDPAFLSKIAKEYPKVKILISYHNFKETPLDLNAVLKPLLSPCAFGYKIATWARSAIDALRMLDFVRSCTDYRISGICMGKHGTLTRILGPVFGNHIDYTSEHPERLQELGQISHSDLFQIYRYDELNLSTALYALIGDPVDHSIGHLFHNQFMKEHQLNALYVKIPIAQEELPLFLLFAKKWRIGGISVTTPLKETILPLIDRIDCDAKKMGAVNTLVLDQEAYRGYNTDGGGAVDALKSVISVKDRKILLLGAGGLARAIAYELSKQGADLRILNRAEHRAAAIASALGCKSGPLEEIAQADYEILINATSHALPIDPNLLRDRVLVMETKYRPDLSPLLLAADKKGCRTVHGSLLFEYQARRQLNLWFSKFQIARDGRRMPN